jgi:hypothetical protein
MVPLSTGGLMLKEFICEVCQKEYQFRISKNRQNSRFCSNACKNKKVGTWVKGNPLGFNWKKATEQEKRNRIEENFHKLVIKQNNGCWDWKGNTKSSLGYGRVQIGKKRTKVAHNISWLIHRGEIPKGKFVLHKCDNPKCTNPDHLFLGTHYENVRDMVYKNRQAKGESCPRSKLKTEQVIEIKKLIRDGFDNGYIAEIYKVTKEAISAIRTGKNWKHID